MLDLGHGCNPLSYEDFHEKSNKHVTWAEGGPSLLCDQSHRSLREGHGQNVAQKYLEQLQEVGHIPKENTERACV